MVVFFGFVEDSLRDGRNGEIQFGDFGGSGDFGGDG